MKIVPTRQIVHVSSKLAQSSHVIWWELQLRLAHHPRTPFSVLKRLADSPHQGVRLALLAHPNLCPWRNDGLLDISVLKSLASEFPEETLTDCVVFNLLGLLEKLDDMFPIVEIIARRGHRDSLHEIFHLFHDNQSIRSILSWNPSTPDKILRALANPMLEPNELVRSRVGSHYNVSPETLSQMANTDVEKSRLVLESVAENKKTPFDALLKLVQSTAVDTNILRHIFHRTDCRLDLQKLIRNHPRWEMPCCHEVSHEHGSGSPRR